MPSKAKHRTRIVTLKSLNREERELQRELLSWGLDAEKNEHHRKFASFVGDYVRGCRSVAPETTTSPKAVDLPQDVEKAIEIVFKDNILTCPKRLELVDDKFHEHDPCCNVFGDARKGKNKVVVKIKWEFDRFSFEALDPMQRFVLTETIDGKERFRNDLLNLHSPAIGGIAFEAIVASHSYWNEACYHCKCRKAVKWAGGGDHPWSDMVCIVCDSAYEIKSKEDMEAIERAGNSNSYFGINGGSYRDYFLLHNQQSRKAGWKHFVVLISRLPSDRYNASTKSYEKAWQVYISEIKRIEPRLKSSSFVSRKNHLPLKSMIVVENEGKPWFKIPSVYFDQAQLYVQVMNQIYPGFADEVLSPKPMEEAAETINNNDAELTCQHLDDLSVDDWEERDTSDDE